MVYLDNTLTEISPEELQNALSDRSDRVSPSQALTFIAQHDIGAADHQDVLKSAVGNTALAPHVRAAAIRLYTLGGGRSTATVLSEALETSEARVVAAAATALGRVGTPEDLPALEAVVSRNDDAFALQCSKFAATLIAHRHRLTDRDLSGFDVELLAAAGSTGSAPFVGVAPGEQRRENALKALQQEFPEDTLAEAEVLEVQCGPHLLEVVVDSELVQAGNVDSLTQAPALVGFILSQDPEQGDFSLASLILTRPIADGGVEVTITRVTGDPVYAGEGKVSNGNVTVSLRAAKSPGAVPVTVQVRTTEDGWEVAGSSGRRAAVASNTPESVDAESI